LAHFPEISLSVSATTRAPRPGEKEGVDYFFVSEQEFDRLIADGELLEYATVHGKHRYGTPRGPIDSALAAGRQVILEIDLQGARQVKRAMPDALAIFIAPPSWDELVRRLGSRATETEDEQRKRLETAKIELEAQGEFDAVVVNDDVAKCAHEVVELMQA
jgi:guanylate kinase